MGAIWVRFSRDFLAVLMVLCWCCVDFVSGFGPKVATLSRIQRVRQIACSWWGGRRAA